MKSPLFLKLVTLLGCMVLLLVPLSLVSNLVSERADYRDRVEDSLRQSTSGPQKLMGPLIAVPVTEHYTVIEESKPVQRKRSYLRYWLPETLQIDGTQKVESRQIGIYDGQIWRNALDIKAQFDGDRLKALKAENVSLGEPFVVVAVSDARGIGVTESPEINGRSFAVEPGTGIAGDLQGLHIPLAAESLSAQALSFTMRLNLSGTGSFSAVPVGRNSEMGLSSNWPHPGFMGSFLPVQRDIGSKGFHALWQSSWFANNLGSQIAAIDSDKWAFLPAFNVSIATPADQYQMTDRAIKYAVLLIVMTFMAFFIFETLTALRIHPMQYLLVGLSLVMFYLVLLALSEHVGFTSAWIAAGLVGALINGVYLRAVLKGWRRSLLFTASLLLLDGIMWVLLNSEDTALLLGTGVLLLALGAVMYLTRNIDWYGLTPPKIISAPEPEPEPDDKVRIWK